MSDYYRRIGKSNDFIKNGRIYEVVNDKVVNEKGNIESIDSGNLQNWRQVAPNARKEDFQKFNGKYEPIGEIPLTSRYRRIGKSTDRLTFGTIYEVKNGKLIDDQGNPMRPCLDYKAKNGIRLWQKVPEVRATKKLDTFVRNLSKFTGINNSNQPQETTTMLKIENVTLINGERSTDYNLDQLITLYTQVKESKQTLLELNINSTGVKARLTQLDADMVSLSNLMDKVTI